MGFLGFLNKKEKLSDMDREDFISLVDNGSYCDQDVIDLYDEIQELREKAGGRE